MSKRNGHIDPATGRNKREVGKLIKRWGRDDEIRSSGLAPAEGGGLRRQNGRPAESRAEWRRREATRGAMSREPQDRWESGPDVYRGRAQ